MKLSHGSTIAVLLVLGHCLGCDDVPSFRAPLITPTVPASEVVSVDGRGGYDWNFNDDGKFVVPRPSPFAFLNGMKGKIQLESTRPLVTEHKYFRPAWMNDPTYAIFKRIAEPVGTQILLDLPKSIVQHPLGFFLDQSGRRFYWIENNQVRFVDPADSTKSSSISIPIPNAFGIVANLSGTQVYVCNSKTIVCLTLPEGTEIARLDSPGVVENWERASQADILVGVTKEHEAFAVDMQTHTLRPCNQSLDRAEFSIHPEGLYALVYAAQELKEWRLNETLKSIPDSNALTMVPYSAELLDPRSLHGVAGLDNCLLVDTYHLLYAEGESPKVQVTNFINRKPVDAWGNYVSHGLTDVRGVECSHGNHRWFLLVGKMFSQGSEPGKYVLLDICSTGRELEHSGHVTLGTSKIARLQSDQEGQTIAILDEAGVKVISRTPWTGSKTVNPFGALANLLIESQDTQQIELFATELRSHDWPHSGLWGEQAYAAFAMQLGQILAVKLKPDFSDSGKMPEIAEWFKQESVLAVIVDMMVRETHSRPGAAAGFRTTKPAYFVQGTQAFESVLQSPRPPAIAIHMKMKTLLAAQDKFRAEAEYLLARCLELYPNYWNIHAPMTDWFAPDRGGYPGIIHDYGESIAKLYPAPLQDEIYCVALARAVDELGRDLFARNGDDLSRERWIRFIKSQMADGSLDQTSADRSIYLFRETEYMKLMTELGELYFYKFPISHDPVGSPISEKMDYIKSVLLKDKRQ